MLDKKISVQVAKDSFWNGIKLFFSKFGGMLFVVLLARLLLPEKFGIYNLTMAIALFFLTFIDVGVNETLMRFFSEAFFKNKKDLAIKRYKYLLKVKFFLTIFLTIVLLALAHPLSVFFKKPDLFLPLIFSSIYLFTFSISSFYEAFFYVFKKVKYLSIRQVLWEILRIILLFLIFFSFEEKFLVVGVIGVLIISTIIAAIFLVNNLRKSTPYLFKRVKSKIDLQDKKRINKFLIYMGVATALSLIFGSIDIVMIGFFLPAEHAGFYSAALSLAVGLATFLGISNILLPVFTNLKSKNISIALERIFRYISLIALPAIFGIFALGSYIITAIYGHEYLSAAFPFYVLAILILEMPITNTIKTLFSAKEKINFLARLLLFSTIINIILNFVLIYFLLKISMVWAITGVAIATVTSRLIYLTSLSLYAKKELKIYFKLNYLAKPILASLLMFSLLTLINYFVTDFNIFIGIFEILFGVLIYFGTMILIKGVTKEDFLFLKRVVTSKIKN